MTLIARIGNWLGGAESLAGQVVLGEATMVLVDIDVTGVDIRRDRVCGIALLPVTGQGFRMADIHYCAVPATEVAGADCLSSLMERIGASPVVCYNPSFVRFMLDRALRVGGLPAITPSWFALEDFLEGAFGKEMGEVQSLPVWQQRLGIPVIREHSAVADVYAMAQLLEMIFVRCQEAGISTLADLLQAKKDQSWLRGH